MDNKPFLATFSDPEKLVRFVQERGVPVFLYLIGIREGQGSIYATPDDVQEVVDSIMKRHSLGKAGEKIRVMEATDLDDIVLTPEEEARFTPEFVDKVIKAIIENA